MQYGYAGGLRRVGEGMADDWDGLWFCEGCGATLKQAHKEQHDNFHKALAELWEMLEKASK